MPETSHRRPTRVAVLAALLAGAAFIGVPRLFLHAPTARTSGRTLGSLAVAPPRRRAPGATTTTAMPRFHQARDVEVLLVSSGKNRVTGLIAYRLGLAGYPVSTSESGASPGGGAVVQAAEGFLQDAALIASLLELDNPTIEVLPATLGSTTKVVVLLAPT